VAVSVSGANYQTVSGLMNRIVNNNKEEENKEGKGNQEENN